MRALFLVLFCLARLSQADPAVITSPSTLVYPDFWHTPLGLHRGSPALLKLMLGDKVHFNDPAGVACTRMLEHGEQSPQITAFGVNSGASQIIYNPDMTSLKVYGQRRAAATSASCTRWAWPACRTAAWRWPTAGTSASSS